MRRSWASVLAVCALVACPALLVGRQAAPTGKAGQPPQSATEADRKYKEILSIADGVLQVDKIVPALEQLIRDYPDYPRLNTVYSTLLSFAPLSTVDQNRIIAFADEAMAKYPEDRTLRQAAMRAKVNVLHAQKKDEVVKDLALKALETETDPGVLQAIAVVDRDDSVKLLEKAIEERRKNEFGAPTLEALNWSYAHSLVRAGRKDDGIRLAQETFDRDAQEIAELEALPRDDPKRSRASARRTMLANRYRDMANLFDEIGDYEKGLQYIALAEQAGGTYEAASHYEARADVYAKMGKSDLALESYALAFASNMEPATRDKIRALASTNGRNPEEIFARARQIRRQHARPIPPFELKTMVGQTVTLGSLKGRAVLLNFFFPT